MKEISLNIGEFRGVATWDADTRCYHGDIVGIRDVVTFTADRLEDLDAEMMASVQDYLAFCERF
jgi:predicted HicB family RNase H-like nuclease